MVDQLVTQKVRPCGSRVLIKRETSAEKKGCIYLPESAQKKPKIGEIVAVGPGEDKEGQHIDVGLSIGQKVIYSSYGGVDVQLESDDEFILLAKDEILAIVE